MSIKGNRQQGQCRIIAGKWRGRKLKFNEADGLRPTTDRIRETVFNWLQPYLPNSYCLDCFAGSGALGFEALSRGAENVFFIEENKKTAKMLIENAGMLNTKNAVVVHDNVLRWLDTPAQVQKPSLRKRFNLVFLDPPFHTELLQKTCDQLNHSVWLTEEAIIYVEHSVKENVVMPDNWVCLKQKRSGQVVYNLYERQ